MKAIKDKTSRKILMEFKTLSRKFWDRHLWARGHFAASSGNVTYEVIMQYIEQQGIEPPDGHFRIDDDNLYSAYSGIRQAGISFQETS